MRNIFYLIFLLFIVSCKHETETKVATMVSDPHSFSKPEDAVVKHLDLDILVDFESHVIGGIASWDIDVKNGNKIIFDTRNLKIESIKLDDGKDANFSFGVENPYLGKSLIVELRPNTKKVIIQYATSPDAAALQWLSADQTAGKEL
ncbi:MAG TPA: hypothetical protein VK590_11460, partial [Saprospiraceae bacterium]|nr:hypothetical protein [Saprospiraceae bacterium]